MEEDETKYCSLIDKLYQLYPNVGKLITDNCLSGAVSRKAMILPNKTTGVSKEDLMQHILYKPYTIDFLKKMDGKYIKSISGHRFIIKTDGSKVELNGVEIKRELSVGPELHKHELFSISSDLKTLPPQTAEEKEAYRKLKESGGAKKKKSKKKKVKGKNRGGDLFDDEQDDEEDEEEGGAKKKKKKKHVGGMEGGCPTCGGSTKKYKTFINMLDDDDEESGGAVSSKKNMIDSLIF
jgi:hypothetical protein